MTAYTTPPNITMKPKTLRIGKVPIIVALNATPETNIARPMTNNATPCRRRRAVGARKPAATDARGELGVLGIESALDLIEHPLLMIGEWHSSLLADTLSRNHR